MPATKPIIGAEKLTTLFELIGTLKTSDSIESVPSDTEHDLVEFLDYCFRTIVNRVMKRRNIGFTSDDQKEVAEFRLKNKKLPAPVKKLLKAFNDYARDFRPEAKKEIYGTSSSSSLPDEIYTDTLPDFLQLYKQLCSDQGWTSTEKLLDKLIDRCKAVLKRWKDAL